jgi:hypothetical protein
VLWCYGRTLVTMARAAAPCNAGIMLGQGLALRYELIQHQPGPHAMVPSTAALCSRTATTYAPPYVACKWHQWWQGCSPYVARTRGKLFRLRMVRTDTCGWAALNCWRCFSRYSLQPSSAYERCWCQCRHEDTPSVKRMHGRGELQQRTPARLLLSACQGFALAEDRLGNPWDVCIEADV